MIGRLAGTIIELNPPDLLLDVAGVGYEVELPASSFNGLPSVGEYCVIYTHLAVREDAHSLYGFITNDEKSLFRTLIKINGVGAKMALNILSSMPARQFVQCVDHQDVDALVKVPGVGKKTAQRLLMELKDKVGGLSSLGSAVTSLGSAKVIYSGMPDALSDATQALVSLGYKLAHAEQLIALVAVEDDDTESLIKKALQKAANHG